MVGLTLILFINLNPVSAVGVGVNPGEIVFNGEENTGLTKELYVINTGSEATTYRIYTDTKNILINPSRITVERRESKVVYISYIPKKHEIENLSYTLYVKSLTNSAQFSVSAGIKVPVRIYNTEKIIPQREEKPKESKDSTGDKGVTNSRNGSLPIIGRVIDFMVGKEQTLLCIILLLTGILVLKIVRVTPHKRLSEKKERGLRDIY